MSNHLTTFAFTPEPCEDFFCCRASAFLGYEPEYLSAVMDYLAAVTDDTVCVQWKPDDDGDWIMDCQDYYDIELLLDLTGCLDAPV